MIEIITKMLEEVRECEAVVPSLAELEHSAPTHTRRGGVELAV